MSGGHGHIEGANKNIAIVIAVLAAFLAIAETGAKGSQTAVLTEHVEATNQWAFFQAKTVRQTVIRTAAEELEAQYKDAGNMPAAVKAQIEAWQRTAARYESEPSTNEGRKELAASAAALTSVMMLAFVAGGLGLVGAALGALGFLAPTLIHL